MRKLVNSGVVWVGLSISIFGFYSCNQSGTNKVQNVGAVDSMPPKKDSLLAVQDSISKVDSLRKDTITKMEENVDYKGTKDTTVLLTDTVSPRYIYLTFDDGPLNGSQHLDSIATAKGIKINAFLIGNHDKMSKKLHSFTERYQNKP
jgi:hypothetical protein